ncbi:MAG: GNAT family N-acetyltransferase [Anaerolineales bacterium]|nr:GNAT family N-acetyltransferase [Anaerolineales bacterium]
MNSDVAMYWVVEMEQGKTVASTSVVREWSDWRAQDYWWIQSMYVNPEHRGRGIPEMLIETLAVEAKENGAADLRLYVHESNHRAIQAYSPAGLPTCLTGSCPGTLELENNPG